jgi:plasmid stabilization system protein ParE
MNRQVVVHPAAEDEIDQAFAWYAERSEIAARAFIHELIGTVRLAVRSPEAWPVSVAETRRIVFPRFPFDLVFRVTDEVIEIVAVAHHRRRPGYWQDRELNDPISS